MPYNEDIVKEKYPEKGSKKDLKTKEIHAKRTVERNASGKGIYMQYYSKRNRNKGTELYRNAHVVYASFLDEEEFMKLPRSFHCHDNTLELILAASGSTLAIIDGIPWNAEAGDIIIYNKESYHQELSEKSRGFSLYCVAASGIQLPGLPENHLCDKNAPKVLHTGDDFEMFRILFSRIFEIVRNGSSGQTAMQDSYLKVLLGEVVLRCQQQMSSLSSKSSNKKSHSGEILKWLNDHYTETVSLQLISEAFSLSPDYISHLFKERFGYSPMQYVNYLRLGQAQIRLIETEDRISDIAVDVGFNNIGNFNRTFYSIVGLSPREFRKAHVNP